MVRLGATLSTIIRSSAIFVYVSELKVRLGAILSTIIRSSAIFVYILRHLFTYQRLKLSDIPYAEIKLSAMFVYIT